MFQAAAWIVLGIFSLIRLEADYLLAVGVCLSLSIANIVGFTKCNKGTSYVVIEKFIVKIYCPSYFALN
jgi:hypothetical protein